MGGLGGLAQQFPTAAQSASCVSVGEEAVMPETHKAAGSHMPQEAADTFVGVERHGLDTLALTFAICELQPHDFTDAPARGIRGHQEEAMPGILRLRA